MNRQTGHQCVRAALIAIAFGDVSATTASNTLSQIPSGAQIVGGDLTVTTAFGASRTADIGDLTDDNRYTASPIDLNTVGRTALTLTGYQHAEAEDLLLKLGGSVPTAGAAVLTILYLVNGAAEYVSG